METLMEKLQKIHDVYKVLTNEKQARLFDASLPLLEKLEQFHVRRSLSESLLMFGKEFAQSVLAEDTNSYSEEELTALMFFTL